MVVAAFWVKGTLGLWTASCGTVGCITGCISQGQLATCADCYSIGLARKFMSFASMFAVINPLASGTYVTSTYTLPT